MTFREYLSNAIHSNSLSNLFMLVPSMHYRGVKLTTACNSQRKGREKILDILRPKSFLVVNKKIHC